MTNKPTCMHDGCTEPVNAKGLCKSHYQKARNASQTKTCREDGCMRPVASIGLCGRHYARMRKKEPRAPFQKETPCRVDSCVKNAELRGYCRKHYSAWLRHGDAEKEIYTTNNPVQCQVTTCRNRQVARGLCRKHYDEFRHVKKSGDIQDEHDFIRFKNRSQKK